MKFLCDRDTLQDALKIVASRAKSAGDNIPILSHVLIEAADQRVKLTGHDLDSCCVISIPAEVSTEGEIAMPAERFSRLVGGLPNGSQVQVETDDKQAKVKAGRSTYQFSIMQASEFPPALVPQDAVSFSLNGKQLARLLDIPSVCILKSEQRFYLRGIYLHLVDKRLAGVATDGHTLLRVITDVKPGAFDGVIVPDTACSEIVRIAGNADVLVEIGKNALAIQCDQRRFVTKLVDGTFPDYARVIPSSTAPAISIEAKDLDAALGRLIAACDPERSPTVLLKWDQDVESINASLTTTFGTGVEQIDCDCKGRDAGEIACQIEYLRKLVDAMGGKVARLLIDGPGDPIKIENPADPDMVAVCMPCRV